MITTVLAEDTALVRVAVEFAVALTGRTPDQVRWAAGGDTSRVASRPALVVVAARTGGEWSGFREEGIRAALRLDPSGSLAFVLVVGGTSGTSAWPLVAALEAAGARCLAPVLHVLGPPQDPAAAISSYCRHWRPAVTAVLGADEARRTA